jgi:hypothetical protein
MRTQLLCPETFHYYTLVINFDCEACEGWSVRGHSASRDTRKERKCGHKKTTKGRMGSFKGEWKVWQGAVCEQRAQGKWQAQAYVLPMHNLPFEPQHVTVSCGVTMISMPMLASQHA